MHWFGRPAVVAGLLVVVLLAGCSNLSPSAVPTASAARTVGVLKVTSSAVGTDGVIPDRYPCDESMSLPFEWSGAPAGTASFVLVVWDRDSHVSTWALANIPATTTSLPVGYAKTLTIDGHYIMYRMCSTTPNIHRYDVTMYAVSTLLDADYIRRTSPIDLESNVLEEEAMAKALAVGRLTVIWNRY